jgi:formylglycine-generating enzyme required for sulfatase activity
MVGATILATCGIYASDVLRVPNKSFLAAIGVGFTKDTELCPDDMVFIDNDRGGYCIDRYENSPALNCVKTEITGSLDTSANLTSQLCKPESKKDSIPWGYVAVHQAEQLCARVGKRLPTNQEWYRAAIGTPDDEQKCAVGRQGVDRPYKTGSNIQCISSLGAIDMIGNVWEWVGETVAEGRLDSIDLPQEGYVSEINDKGVVSRTSTTSDHAFGEDYLFIDKTDTRGIFRGGFWSMNERAGLYTMNVTMSPSFQGVAVGFRCAKSVQQKKN